jgi:hypothetical protein
VEVTQVRSHDIAQRDVDRVLKLTAQSEDSLYGSLGEGYVYEYTSRDVKCSMDYTAVGKRFWEALGYELYGLICDRARRQPQDWVEDLISGDVRNLAIGIVAAIASEYNVSLGIAVPAAALVIKKGVGAYCSHPPKHPPQKPVKTMLAEKKARATAAQKRE